MRLKNFTGLLFRQSQKGAFINTIELMKTTYDKSLISSFTIVDRITKGLPFKFCSNTIINAFALLSANAIIDFSSIMIIHLHSAY